MADQGMEGASTSLLFPCRLPHQWDPSGTGIAFALWMVWKGWRHKIKGKSTPAVWSTGVLASSGYLHQEEPSKPRSPRRAARVAFPGNFCGTVEEFSG